MLLALTADGILWSTLAVSSTSRFYISLKIISLLITITSFINAHPLGLKPNRFWRCVGCKESSNELGRVFGAIRDAVTMETRHVFFALDMTWLDRLLSTESNVLVHYIMPMHLQNITMPAPKPPSKAADEVFQVVFSELPTTAANDSFFPADDVDKFLTRNPCWFPLREPMYAFSAKLSPQGKSNKAGFRSRAVGRAPASRHLVLIRLPSFRLHATCQLFMQITRHQFPAKCEYKAEKMAVHYLGNIGWSNTLNGLLFKFVEMFRRGFYPHKILVMPRAAEFRQRVRRVFEMNGNGSELILGGGWAWAESTTCPPEIEWYDPWSCNFLPLSNCTSRSTGVLLGQPPYPAEMRDRNYVTPDAIFEPGFIEQDVDGEMNRLTLRQLRTIYEDAPRHSEEEWTYTRFYVFLQRPNARLRYFIRRSMMAVAPVGPRGGANARNVFSSSLVASHSGFIGEMRLPCISVHVRHGDAAHDWRGSSRIDRTMPAHIMRARNISQSLAVTTMFIASDNRTAIITAPHQFPQYHWYTQHRPIKDNLPTFEVKNENDVQIELSHVIADIRTAGACTGIVATFDSGVAEQMVIAGCAINPAGYCPTSVDLRVAPK